MDEIQEENSGLSNYNDNEILKEDKECQTEIEIFSNSDEDGSDNDSPIVLYERTSQNNSPVFRYRDITPNLERKKEIFKKDSLIKEIAEVSHVMDELKDEINDINSIMIDLYDSSSSSDSSILEHISKWNIREVKYNRLKKRIMPLDVIFFSGNDFISKTIKFLQEKKLGNGSISHIGLIVNKDILPNVPNLEKDKLYIWESTSSVELPFYSEKAIDVVSGQGKFGIQIRDLEQVIEHYLSKQDTAVYWGKLRENPWRMKDNEDIKIYKKRRKKTMWLMEDIYDIYGTTRYDNSLLDLFASLFPSMRPVRNSKLWLMKKFKSKKKKNKFKGKLFCSEFVSMIYKTLNIIPEHINPSDVVPVDFLGYDQDGMPFLLSKLYRLSI